MIRKTGTCTALERVNSSFGVINEMSLLLKKTAVSAREVCCKQLLMSFLHHDTKVPLEDPEKNLV